MARVTLQTVADRVGVSRMTVSNAFSRPDQLSPALRDKILSAADQLGYVGPDPAARTLARGATGTVGILLTNSLRDAFTDEVATAFLGAIAEELAPTGLSLTLLSAMPSDNGVPARDVAMDGALVYSCNPDSSALDWLRRRKLPLVYVDQMPAKGVSSVNVQDRAGARAAAQHLIDLGHRHVAIVTSAFQGPFGVVDEPAASDEGFVTRERMTGWREALTAIGAAPLVVRAPHGSDQLAYETAHDMLSGPRRPTGVLCFSDRVAHEVVRAAQDLGLEVPGDLSVVGFDDNPLARRMRPALTTVRQDVSAKGHAAAGALAQVMKAARAGVPARARHVELPTELVVRNSTGLAPPSRRRGRAD